MRGSARLIPGLSASPLEWFSSDCDYKDWIQDLANLSGARIDPVFPSAGGRLMEPGLRWHAIFPPVIPAGPALAFRRERFRDLTFADFRCSEGLREGITRHVLTGGGLLISGPTGSGKTSLLAMLLKTLLSDRRIVIVESVPELHDLSEVFVEMTCRPPNIAGIGEIGPSWLVHEALRMRPQGIVVGEIRGCEAGAFLNAVTSGHPNCMATIHSETIAGAQERLDYLCAQTAIGRFACGKRSSAMVSSLGFVQLKDSNNGGCPEISDFSMDKR